MDISEARVVSARHPASGCPGPHSRTAPSWTPLSAASPYSAARTLTTAQAAFLGVAAIGLGLAVARIGCLSVVRQVNDAALLLYGLLFTHRLSALLAGLARSGPAAKPRALTEAAECSVSARSAPVRTEAVGGPDDTPLLGDTSGMIVGDDLSGEAPLVSILVPLYREAGVVAQIVGALSRLHHTPGQVETLLLLEQDDEGTRRACERIRLPAGFRAVIVPPGQPRTKPRACNYGLGYCRGEITVVFDAEDQPETDQLQLAIGALQEASSRVACVQARLAYYNPRQNLLTRWFAAEYASWFEVMLPGLYRLRAPIPLGGTSNYFRTDALRSVGGWDPWNVAEDCDLGMRLARNGYQVWMLDSTTWEEACPSVGPWIRQRSRWIKGYLQTWLVHNRRPLTLIREIGPWGFLNLQLTVGATVFSLLLNPFYWLLAVFWFVHPTRTEDLLLAGPFHAVGAFCLVIGNPLFAFFHAVGPIRRKQWDLAALAALAPLYWVLMSIAAWKALVQLVVAPHHWEKTAHGLAHMPPTDALASGVDGAPPTAPTDGGGAADGPPDLS